MSRAANDTSIIFISVLRDRDAHSYVIKISMDESLDYFQSLFYYLEGKTGWWMVINYLVGRLIMFLLVVIGFCF